MEKIRTFDSGANRNASHAKRDIMGFTSPLVTKGYSDYMHRNRFLANGEFRASDNWKKGIPLKVYMECMQRHNLDVLLAYEGYNSRHDLLDSLYGLKFNVDGMIHELIKVNLELLEFEEDEL